MPKRNQKQLIQKQLSEIKGIWQTKDIESIAEQIISLQQFLSESNNNSFKSSSLDQVSPEHISYQQSLFHFFLYYCPSPNHSFVWKSENTVFFAAFTGRKNDTLMITCPFSKDTGAVLDSLNWLLSNSVFSHLLQQLNIDRILLRDITDEIVNKIRKQKKEFLFQLDSLKELHYATYDVNKTLNLQGLAFANLRWHLNKFKKKDHTVEVVSSKKEIDSAVHLIGKWRSHAVKKRGFSFADVRSDKLGLKIISEIHDEKQAFTQQKEMVGLHDILARILKVDGRIAAINIGYPLGIFSHQKVFAHAIGISDLSISHLAEFAQYDFWKQVHQAGYQYINDGPSWRRSLEMYKNKFRPIAKKRYYWATLSLH